MKNIDHLISVLALTLGACGNKAPAASTDCSAAIESAVAIGLRVQIEGQHLSEATVAAMKAKTLSHCTDDKWSVGVVSCLKASSTNDAINHCLEDLPHDARVKWQTDMAKILDSDKGSAGSGSGSGGSGSAAGSGSATLPADCVAYQELMARLASCDAFPKPQREAYEQAYKRVLEAFDKSTAEGREQMASGCKTTVDVIRQSAGATCGW